MSLRFWNIQVHIWLKNYIQERMSAPGKRAPWYAAQVTFLLSAMWHGFTLGTYVGFYSFYCTLAVGKVQYKSRYLFRNVPLTLQHLFGLFLTQFMFNLSGVPFRGYQST